MFKVYHTADGLAIVRYTVAGSGSEGAYTILPITDIQKLTNNPGVLRIDRVFFSVEKGMRLGLHWEDNDSTLIFPLEDRGIFQFEDWFGGWSNPKNPGWTGNILLSVLASKESRVQLFALKLELTKQT